MRTIPNEDEIDEIIGEHPEFRHFGLRIDSRQFQIGDIIPNSWHDPGRCEHLDVELDGVCAFEISSDPSEALKRAVRWLADSADHHMYLVAGHSRNYGRTLQDCYSEDCELIPAGTETGFEEEGACCIPRAVVLACWAK